MTEWSLNRRDFMGLSGGFAGALLGSRTLGGFVPSAHADSAGASAKPVPPPDLTGRDGIPFVDCSKYRAVKEDLGRYIYFAPEKLGGGSHAVDLYQGKTLAWISYWAYGDTCPISHHLAAYPSPDPYQGFEFVNSTQGGDNILIYGLNTKIRRSSRTGSRAVPFGSRGSSRPGRPASSSSRAPRATRSTGRWCRWRKTSSRPASSPAPTPVA